MNKSREKIFRKNVVKTLKELLLSSTRGGLELRSHAVFHEAQLNDILRRLEEMDAKELVKELLESLFQTGGIFHIADGMLHNIDDKLGTDYRQRKQDLIKKKSNNKSYFN